MILDLLILFCVGIYLVIKISTNHSSNNIQKPDVVVYSSAVEQNNSEILMAKQNKIPVIRRAEMLAELLKLKSISMAFKYNPVPPHKIGIFPFLDNFRIIFLVSFWN